MRDDELQRTVQRPGQRHLAFKALEWKRSGVFIVRLREAALCDHAVVLDTNNRMIIDCALVLSAHVLERCGGAEATKFRLCEVREVRRICK